MAVQGELGDNNFITGFLVNTLDPNIIYEHFTAIAGIAAVAPWLFVIYIAFRIAQESVDGLSGKAALAEAFGDVNKAVLMYIAYTAGGLLVFALLLTLGAVFQGVGSEQLIHIELVELRTVLMADPEAQRAWYEQLLDVTTDVFSIGSAALLWGIYQFLSVAYIFLARLIDVIFALGIALTYAWGFIAIVTSTAKGHFNLMPGFSKTILTFGIWLILEPLLLFFVWLLSLGAVEWMGATQSGRDLGTAAMTMWYAFSCLMMILILLIKIIAPFLALYLARNDSMVGALGAGPAVMGTLVANQIISRLSEGMQNGVQDMMPSSEGTRTRDRMAQGLGDVMNTPMGQLSQGVKGLFGDGGNNDLTASSGIPGADGAGSSPESSDSTSPGVESSNSGAGQSGGNDQGGAGQQGSSPEFSTQNDLTSGPGTGDGGSSVPGDTSTSNEANDLTGYNPDDNPEGRP